MRKLHFFNNSMKTAAAVCCSLLLATSFIACKDSDDNNDSKPGEEPTKEEVVMTYDDLAYFQNSIIQVGENGNIIAQYVGEVLFADDPQHLYIGVDTYEEAEAMFRQWIAPDVKLATTAPLIAQLTDNEGKEQGTITFTKSTEGGHVAEVTASVGTQLKHFNKVSFLLNSAWPHNAATPTHHVGDIINVTLFGLQFQDLKEDDHHLKFVCIQEERNGQKPIFVGITKHGYDRKNTDYGEFKATRYCPNLERSTVISNILRTRWDSYCIYFENAGCGKLSDDPFWINEYQGGWLWDYDEYMYFASGLHYGASNSRLYKDYDFQFHFLLKIDWLSDSQVSAMLTPTKGSGKCGGGESYENIFDNNTKTKWFSWRDSGEEVWFVEFNSRYPIVPKGYKLFTGNDTQYYPGRNPTKWKLFGKYDETDEWTLLDERDTDKNPADALPAANQTEKSFTIKNEDDDDYQYFRLEISDSKDAAIQLSEFMFIY